MDNFFFVMWIPRYHFFVQCSCRKFLSDSYLKEGVFWSDKPTSSKYVEYDTEWRSNAFERPSNVLKGIFYHLTLQTTLLLLLLRVETCKSLCRKVRTCSLLIKRRTNRSLKKILAHLAVGKKRFLIWSYLRAKFLSLKKDLW